MKKWLGLFGVFGLSLALIAGGAAAQVKSSGGYATLPSPQPVETGAKIEVIEFFWYGCPHCFDLEPNLKKWMAKLPKDVEMRRVPAIPHPRWAPGARTYYTLEALGELDRLHGEVFEAIHIQRANLADEMTQLDWMAKRGVDRRKFTEASNSFSVQSKIRRASQLSQNYPLFVDKFVDGHSVGVPSFIVDGKYLTSASIAGGPDAMFRTLDSLIAKARAERGKK
jgi:thiol:disulfide interchange protein DsbA